MAFCNYPACLHHSELEIKYPKGALQFKEKRRRWGMEKRKGRTAVIRETEKGGMAEEIGEVSGRPGKNREEEKRSS